MSVTGSIINLSGYKFAPLVELPALRDHLLGFTAQQGVKGTVLLSPEGINVCSRSRSI